MQTGEVGRVPSGPQKPHTSCEVFLFMGYYVYVIQSLKDKSYYKGFSEYPIQKLQQYNEG